MKILSIVAACLLAAACSTQPDKTTPDTGKVEGNIYTNDYFSMELQVPQGWVVQNKEEMDALTEESKNILEESQPEMKVDVDSLQNNTVQMLTVFEHALTDTSAFNASFVLMAERLMEDLPSIDEKVYLSLAASQLAKSGFYSGVDASQKKVKVGGRDFLGMKASMSVDINNGAYQEFLVRKENDYMLIIILSYRTESQYKILDSAVQSIAFH